MLREILGCRKAVESAVRNAAGDPSIGAVCDHWHAVVVKAEAHAREAVGEIEAASDEAYEWVEEASGVKVCFKCECLLRGEEGHWLCGCRVLLAARLAAVGSVHQDVDEVRAGRWLDSDDELLREAGEIAVAGMWEAAEAKAAESWAQEGEGCGRRLMPGSSGIRWPWSVRSGRNAVRRATLYGTRGTWRTGFRIPPFSGA